SSLRPSASPAKQIGHPHPCHSHYDCTRLGDSGVLEVKIVPRKTHAPEPLPRDLRSKACGKNLPILRIKACDATARRQNRPCFGGLCEIGNIAPHASRSQRAKIQDVCPVS